MTTQSDFVICRMCKQRVAGSKSVNHYIRKTDGVELGYCLPCWRDYSSELKSRRTAGKIRKRKPLKHQNVYNYLTLTRLVDDKFIDIVARILSGDCLLFPVIFMSRHTLNEYLIKVTPICTDGKEEAAK